MKFITTYKLSIALLIISLICLVSYQLQGSYIDENGMLVEPFALIPLFWLCLVLAAVSGLVTFFKEFIKNT
ncbi:DUF3955 domain-containing protein [Thalassotalea marina]|uniref:DUF3955 domain-containing protein n=1 Tax=Thalassotalea marina TaxID=1673741 RepID=A0A919BDP1_9GAMM|nr:DUF3955 domain-containing protein [Thalassotalea marina]GHF81723.1 hypothetical protein GCM10017161_06510 [Thalassotalea marina]